MSRIRTLASVNAAVLALLPDLLDTSGHPVATVFVDPAYKPERKVLPTGYAPNGAKEIARRKRQIAKGMLKVQP